MDTSDIWTNGGLAAFSIICVIGIIGVIFLIARTYDLNMNGTQDENGTGLGHDIAADLESTRPLGGVYLMREGEIVPFVSPEPEDALDLEDWYLSQSAIRFMLYALERDDWKYEFSEWESTLEETIQATKKAVETERIRKSLKVIQGGKEKEQEDINDE